MFIKFCRQKIPFTHIAIYDGQPSQDCDYYQEPEGVTPIWSCRIRGVAVGGLTRTGEYWNVIFDVPLNKISTAE